MHIPRSTNQVQTIFGGHVPEQRADETARHLPPPETRIVNFREATSALRMAMLAELVKALRAALSLGRSAR